MLECLKEKYPTLTAAVVIVVYLMLFVAIAEADSSQDVLEGVKITNVH